MEVECRSLTWLRSKKIQGHSCSRWYSFYVPGTVENNNHSRRQEDHKLQQSEEEEEECWISTTDHRPLVAPTRNSPRDHCICRELSLVGTSSYRRANSRNRVSITKAADLILLAKTRNSAQVHCRDRELRRV